MDIEFKNVNGTYNGVKMLSAVSGLSQEEIMWMWDRMKQLKLEKKTSEEAKLIISEEAKLSPWIRK